MKLSPLCLGGAGLGTSLGETESYELLDAFVDLGGTMIDTAVTYADWQSEEKSASEKLLGRWQRSRRHDHVTVATKGACPRPGRFFRLRPADIRHDLESSLGNLGVDRIELYWLHRDDPEIDVAEILGELNEHIVAGRIGAIGCSNWTLPRIVAAADHADEHGMVGFSADQMMWSLSDTDPAALSDQTLVLMDDSLHAHHVRLAWPALPFSSQAGGFFSGRYRPGTPPTGRDGFVRMYWTDANFARLARVESLAQELGEPPAAVALAWLLNQPFPVSPIIGASSVEQLTESWRATTIDLDHDVVSWLTDPESASRS